MDNDAKERPARRAKKDEVTAPNQEYRKRKKEEERRARRNKKRDKLENVGLA